MNDHHLTDSDLDQVSSGMTCQTSLAVSSIYLLTAQALNALGDPAGSQYFSGKAAGVLEGGGCPK
jgi:hypothetical protein